MPSCSSASSASCLAELRVPLGFGTLQWGDTALDARMVRGGNTSMEELQRVADVLLASGITFFDSAEGYGGGSCERRLGELLRDSSSSSSTLDEVCVATKFLPTFWRGTKGSLLGAARASRVRLGLAAQGKPIPLYFIHTPVHFRSVEFWVEACCDAADAGLIEEIGVSNFNANQVTRAVRAAARRGRRIAANQVMFSLLDFNSEKLQETVAKCKEHGVVVVAYSPVGQGLLTDGLTREKFGTIRAAKMTRVRWEDLTALRDAINRIAHAHERTMAQVCLNWVMAHDCVPLVGCRSVEQAEDSLGAVGWNLKAAEVVELDRLALARSTLEGSSLKRGFFATLFGVVILVYRLLEMISPPKKT